MFEKENLYYISTGTSVWKNNGLARMDCGWHAIVSGTTSFAFLSVVHAGARRQYASSSLAEIILMVPFLHNVSHFFLRVADAEFAFSFQRRTREGNAIRVQIL